VLASTLLLLVALRPLGTVHHVPGYDDAERVVGPLPRIAIRAGALDEWGEGLELGHGGDTALITLE
jgi:hypothetical protein